MQKIQHYVLFPNHDNGMRLYGILKEAGIKTTIAPTPRVASKCCASHCSLSRRPDTDPEIHRRESDRNIKNCRH